jgi:hypothetical protein
MGPGDMQPDQVVCPTDQPIQHRGIEVDRQQIRQRCKGELLPHHLTDRGMVTARMRQGNKYAAYID